MKPGDVFLKYNGFDIARREDMVAAIRQVDEAAEAVEVQLERDGMIISLDFKPGQIGVKLSYEYSIPVFE